MKYFVFLFFISLHVWIFAQENSENLTPETNFSYNNTAQDSSRILDTLYTYNVDLYETTTPFGIKYTVNGKEITKKQYDKYRQYWRAIDACTPCLLRTFDMNDKIMYEAYQYVDCLCGQYTEFYKDGSIKTEGQFMKNPDNNWQNFNAQQFCNRKTGIWKYFYSNGTVEKIEEYLNGVLVTTKGNSEMIPAIDVYNRENQQEDMTIENKKPFFNRKNKF